MAELNTYFTRGMIQDSLESLQPEGSYRFAFNAVTQSKDRSNFGLTNEEEIEQVASLGGTIVGKSYIEERNKTLLFVQSEGSQLWLFDHKTNQIQFVCSDTEFSCDWGFSNCEFIYGEFKKFNKCKELHVYWSSECTYHVVNIDEMLNPTRKAAVKTLDDVCGHFDLFKPVCGPHISAIPSKFNGSTLEAGSYACAIQLSDTDGNTSNVFDISQFAVAESEDNIGGQTSKSSIKFHISSLDKRYNKAIIYIIKTVKGVTVIEKMDSLSYSDKGITYEYYGQKGEIVHVSNLITRNKAYLRGQDLLQKDGWLFFYSLRNEKNLNYQKYANQISCKYVEWESSFEQCSKYFYVSLLRGEAYAIAIVFKFADGTFSNAYHIPGGVAGASILENRVSTAASSSGLQFDIGALVTTNQFTRHRNPSELKDRANESDKLEDSTNTDVDNIDTNRDNIVDSGTCHDNLYECTTANTVLDQDIDDVSNTMESNAELLAGMGIDDPDPDVNTTSNLKESALKLIEDAVTNREYVRRQRPRFNLGADPSSVSIDNVEAAVLAEDRGDNWVDGDGKPLTDEVPVELSSGPMEVYTSNIDYPKDKDCDGEFFYPQGKIKHHKVPWTSQLPHFVSDTFGVENQYQPDNHPYSKTRIRTIGLRLENIHIPTEDELPKPLCPNSPFKIVYVKRTDQNKSIFAKGWLNGIFTGECNGTTYAFPRHGVNSFEHVDRMISTGDGGLSRLGAQSDDPVYNFHSPDTDSDKSGIPVNKIKPELQLKGNGWKYGLYAEGKKPVNQWEGTRDDAFGCRIGNNLSQYTTASGGLINLAGITEAPANTSPTKVASMTYPLMNRFRESSIYLQAASRLPGDERDQSFIGGVVDHFAPTKCNAPYAALVRDIPDQYGSIEGLRYADLGINATTKHADGLTTISGICGDTYVGPYSKKRTSYISNKKGDLFNVPAKPGSPCRQRAWCDSPEDKIFEYLGIDYYPTKIPKSGDIYDPKNYAGLHTINGNACGGAVTKRDAQAPMTSESDWYGPKTLSGVVHTIVECEVNPYLRESGEGSQLVEGKVHYRNLKDLHLDAAAPVGQPHEGSWLGRFHSFVQQPSVKQLTKKAAIRTALTLGGPAGALINLSSLEGIIGPAFAMMGWSMLSALWILATNTLFTDKRLNEMLRIGECKRDEEGGDLDAESIRGFEDNYTVYNRDHTRINDIYPYTAFPLPFNTCDCNDCDKSNINNDIYYSNKQNPDSDIDAYKNVKINNYQNIPCHYGDLKRMIIVDNQVFTHLTDGLALVKLNPIQMQSDIVLQQSGDGQMLTEPQIMYEGVAEGFAGTEHPNAGILTPYGYFFVDNRASKLYRFSGSPEEISSYGMYNFFKNSMPFCNEKECYDEKAAEGNHYSLGWDPRLNRLLITKYDGDKCNSWTISFEPRGEQSRYVSFHSYVPQDYFWDRENIYSYAGGKIYKHHKSGSYGKCYGENVSFIVETSVPGGQAFKFKTFELDTRAEKGFVKDLDKTFNKIAVYNSTQGTGTRDVIALSDNPGKINNQYSRSEEDPSKIVLHKVRRRWKSNDVFDLVKDGCSEESLLTKECECTPLESINEEVFDCNVMKTQDYRGREMEDDHIMFRFVYDEANDTRLYLKRLKIETY